MFQTNQQIGGYVLIKQIGRGGFGEVWLAEKRSQFVTKKVAIKLPLDAQVNFEAIRQEAELWEQASGHVNVLPIIDADVYDGQVIIVSEFAEGGSLAEKLLTEGKFSPEKALEMTIGILNGLDYLHSQKIIHRDIKPQNILLQRDTPRLADFGISRAFEGTTNSVTVSGTDAYMAPEAFEGKRNVQTDLWSMGVVLYQLLSNNLPFPQANLPERMFAILTKEVEPLSADIPESLRQIVQKSLAKSPENRYQSATQMRQDLEKALIQIKHPTFMPTEVLEKERIEPISEPNLKPPIDNSTLTDVFQPEIPPTVVQSEIPPTVVQPLSKVLPTVAVPFGNKTNKRPTKTLFNIGTGILALIVFSGIIGIIVLLIVIKPGANTTANRDTNKNSDLIKDTKPSSKNHETIKNLIGMEFVKIPAGTFMMGSENGSPSEKPVHKVTISKDFYLGKYEVTQAEWKALMGKLPTKCDFGTIPSEFIGDNKPIVCVSWEDAQGFIKKLNDKGEGTYRLPTEAEREYATRAGTTSDNTEDLDSMAWYYKTSGNKLQEVGTKQPNAWGLYDMQGNVWEWCQDWDGVYPSGDVIDPTGPKTGLYRVHRDGGYANRVEDLRSTMRGAKLPTVRMDILGFRVLRKK